MKKSYLVDHHAHYTGSLPLGFIWSQLKSRNLDLKNYQSIWDKLLPDISYKQWVELNEKAKDRYFYDFSKSLKNSFTKNWQVNMDIFHQVYEFFQFISKSKQEEEAKRLYQQGAYAIAKSYYEEGVNYFELKSGPSTAIEETIWRLESMNNGLEQFEKEVGLRQFCSITLTFISKNGVFINFSWRLLKNLFEILDQPLGQRINGFDFSGDETKESIKSQLEIIDEIERFNNRGRLTNKKEVLITIHVGENFKDVDTDYHLIKFTKLCNKKLID